MKLSIATALAIVSASMMCAVPAAAEQLCLSDAEIAVTGSMISVMATGAALRHCAECLGPDRYGQAVADYDAAGLMGDFRRAQDAITSRERYEYSDGIVREMARRHSEKLSETCDACTKMAEMLKLLHTPQAREKFYAAQTTEVRRTARQCP